MKQSTKLIAILILVIIWVAATFYATNTMEILPFGTFLERYMVLTPFIALIGILAMIIIEKNSEARN